MLEASTLQRNSGLQPLLLLDDPFAELDIRRSQRILSVLMHEKPGQTIFAVPRGGDIPAEMMQLERNTIVNGVVSKTT
jgi:recombinational DNA repair ATPase RecF